MESTQRTIAKLAAIKRTGAKKVKSAVPTTRTAKIIGIDSITAAIANSGRLLMALTTSIDNYTIFCSDSCRNAPLPKTLLLNEKV